MENPYKRKKEPELNKQLILDTATDIAAAGDWHQVTFQAIADKTGLSKGGIIHHFSNKEELLDELMKESLHELTEWVQSYKKRIGGDHIDGSAAYLKFVISKGKDERYRKTMRTVVQAIMFNAQYRERWEKWYKENILPGNGKDLPVKSLVTLLVADGIWYAENMGYSMLSMADKERILTYLNA